MGTMLANAVNDYTVFDLETTGFSSHTDHIVEVGAVRVRGGFVVSTYSSLMSVKHNAGEPWNHIPDEFLTHAPGHAEVLSEFTYFLGDDILIGHNIHDFDLPFLNNKLRETIAIVQSFGAEVDMPMEIENDYVDTLILARNLLPDLPHHRLADLAEHYNIEVTTQHRALADCLTTFKVYEKLKEGPGAIQYCPECNRGFVVLKHRETDTEIRAQTGTKVRYWACTSCDWTHEILNQKGTIREMMGEIKQIL